MTLNDEAKTRGYGSTRHGDKGTSLDFIPRRHGDIATSHVDKVSSPDDKATPLSFLSTSLSFEPETTSLVSKRLSIEHGGGNPTPSDWAQPLVIVVR